MCGDAVCRPVFMHAHKRIYEDDDEGPTVSAGRGISSRYAEFGFFSAEFEPRISPRNSYFNRGIPRNLTFFIRTTIFSQKMTAK